MKQARGALKWHAIQEPWSRQQSSLAEQRPKLIEGHDERDQIDHAERPGDDETAQPVVGSREPVRDCDLPNIGRRTTCMISSLSNWVDSDREHQDFQDRCRMACRADP